MRPKIREETWPYIDRFFQEDPEAMHYGPTVRKLVEEAVQKGVQEGVQEVRAEAAQGEQRGWHRTLHLDVGVRT